MTKRSWLIIRTAVTADLQVYAVCAGTTDHTQIAIFEISSVGFEYHKDKNLWIPTNYSDFGLLSNLWTYTKKFFKGGAVAAFGAGMHVKIYEALDTYIRNPNTNFFDTALIRLGQPNYYEVAENQFKNIFTWETLTAAFEQNKAWWAETIK